jgi:peptidoglycan DL-endopeptidase CwlO
MSSRLRSLLPLFALAAGVLALAGPILFAGSLVGQRAGAAPGEPLEPKPKPYMHRHAAPPAPLGVRAAKIALRAVGVPYRWGGASLSGGFDCSGLVYWTYARLGISLPHSSYALYGTGRAVSRSRMRPGDVLFFSGLGHVGLYLGRGRMVHAPYTGRRVEIVRLGRSHYGSRLIGARRVVSM